MKVKRFIENQYVLNNIDIKKIESLIKNEIAKKEKLFDSECPPTMNKAVNSLGKKKTDISFYVGTGGNIYLYWRQYIFHKKSAQYLKKFKDALQTNLDILNSKPKNNDTNSFFMGDSGIYLFCCIYGMETKNEKYFIESFYKLIELRHLGNKYPLELDLLYGITGYLYSLLFLKKYLIDLKKHNFKKEEKKLDDMIKEVFFELIEKGINNMIKYKWNNCLLYPFPLNYDSYFYLGAAHGLIGVIYLLLCTIQIYPDILTYECKPVSEFISKNYSNLSNLILINLNYIKSLQIESTGNFPDDVEGKDNGDKTYFCHGCVGAVHLFLLAEKIFPSNNFEDIAKNCNKCLWKRGILYKGNGLCHGMSSICYALIKLYKHTKDELYLNEAMGIAFATVDPEIQALVSEYKDPQRKKKGVPDTPYSLMEGDGGLLIMYYDLISLINGNSDIMTGKFPGYEII